MARLVVLFIGLSLVLSAHAAPVTVKPRVALLTSLDFDKVIPRSSPLYDYYHGYDQNLGSIFARLTREWPFEVDTFHRVDGYELHRILTSGRYIGVFYLSHAGFSDTFAMQSVIPDYALNDIKSAFREIHPNVKFLALIGCRTQKIIDKLRDQGGYFQGSEGVKLFGFEDVIEPRQGLSEATRAFEREIKVVDTTDCRAIRPVKHGLWFHITRRVPAQLQGIAPAAFVEMGSKIVAVFPPAAAGEVQEKERWVEVGDISDATQLKITASSGGAAGLGDFEFDAPLAGQWTVFAHDGVPFGVSKHVYRYTGTLPTTTIEKAYYPYACVSFKAH